MTSAPAPNAAALYRLMSWLSPAYPVGAYSYSHGLEQAVEAGLVRDRDSLLAWLADILAHGGAWNDAVLLANAYAAAHAGDAEALAGVGELGAALAPTRELALESLAQGRAFLAATADAWPAPGLALAEGLPEAQRLYPVMVGLAAAAHGVPLHDALLAYLQALAGNLVSAALRLVPLGQSDGQRALAALEPAVARAAGRARDAGLDALGGAAWRVEIASMHHETQYTRLFRS